jgi:hypothetical protein
MVCGEGTMPDVGFQLPAGCRGCVYCSMVMFWKNAI